MGVLKNKASVFRDIELAMAKIEEAPVALYRKTVLEIFTRIVMQTPQYTGRAVANWNIGINSPDMSFDPGMGGAHEMTKGGHIRTASHEKGDPKWAEESLERAKYVVRRIKRGDIVYITNATRGDGGEAYLTELQNPATWAARLRAVNQPYETAMESAMFVAEGLLSNGTMPLSGLQG